MVSYALLLLVLVETFQEHLVSYNVMRGQCLCTLFYTSGTGDLVDVLAVVRDINNWKELGLQLGLVYPSLERIDLEQRGRITFSIMAMLSAWLQQQDNVLQKGVPSWSVLRAALQSMGEHETADRIHSN